MRESCYGFRGVRVGEASNPGPPTTRSRARMEEEAEAVLSGLEAALTRIDDSSDDEPCMPTWKDEDCEREEVGRRADVRNVWARVGDVECHTAVDPGSLVRDECGSVRSESCWGEMEDIDEDEDVEWGTLPPTVSHAVPVSQGEELGPHTVCVASDRGRR